ncbi:carboxylesterase type B [Aaosphaeria arxii CBS 175.79]|uniref:Carboxylic ester hydrolase n=1 Tax=Aaosphaeria arxii CBS 175.79 TaxID=1450172 RepID=A0A6A5X8S5_9PLEO|nr:carboxylesterase type B [Aaosphaeria arxii CBS 175.79]KAF2009465.1 carboxylesterase type B [Aaosphaeria arxii CBS 175.79]
MRFLPTIAALSGIAYASTDPTSNPFDVFKGSSLNASDAVTVDLGYEIYQGASNATTGLNVFQGIRYAAAPVGSLRWQEPQTPVTNRNSVIAATSYAPSCPQSPASNGYGISLLPSSEDCLFLNVYAPSNASNLPVLVWIHGGGYGVGDGAVDFSSIINANNDGFIGISIQYRLGAFGFLSSDEVFRNGIVNGGLLDQQLALKWVQAYIHLFGGDPTQVTISGVSAGAGSVMLHDIAYGGSLGTSLFTNSISASPFLPQQHGYKDWIPTQSYYAFATAAGCPPTWAYGNSSQTIFECLISKDTDILQKASAVISSSGITGNWAFYPVTDGTLLQSTPSQALQEGHVNGLAHLSGNNAEEGIYFVAQNITTQEGLVNWVKLSFPLITDNDIAKLLEKYSTDNYTGPNTLPRFATAGDTGLTAVNVSQITSGQQQRANNIYAESTFVCPSYWLADAYSSNGKSGYKYQYSVPNAAHGADTPAYFGPPTPNLGPDFVLAVQHIWGNFIINGNPSIPVEIARGSRSNATSSPADELANWPQFTLEDPKMVNLNETGGTEYQIDYTNFGFPGVIVIQHIDPGLQNNLRVVDANAWEGGRGSRCNFWRDNAVSNLR